MLPVLPNGKINARDLAKAIDLKETQAKYLYLKRQRRNIELASSITCHKAQGNSVDVVMIVAENCPLVSREWLAVAR